MARGESGKLAPFHLLSEPGVTAAEQRACSELWIRDRLAASRPERAGLDFRFDRGARAKIRLGYLSSDFQDHATALLLIETLEAHDRARFEVHRLFLWRRRRQDMRQRLEQSLRRLHRHRALSRFAAAAQAIHADGIDILIDLKGYTQYARTDILLFVRRRSR